MAARRRGFTRRNIKRDALGRFARVAGSARRRRDSLRGRRARTGMNMRFRKVSTLHRVNSAYARATAGSKRRGFSRRQNQRVRRRVKMGALQREAELFGFTPGKLARDARRTQRRFNRAQRKWNR